MFSSNTVGCGFDFGRWGTDRPATLKGRKAEGVIFHAGRLMNLVVGALENYLLFFSVK